MLPDLTFTELEMKRCIKDLEPLIEAFYELGCDEGE